MASLVAFISYICTFNTADRWLVLMPKDQNNLVFILILKG